MIGIYDCFGYGAGYEVSFEERYKLIKNAGFDCVMLWWSDKFGRGNGGKYNQHQLPFDGSIDWAGVMKKIAITGYQGATTLEPMNWDYEDLTIQQFLDTAYQKAVKIDEMRVA